MNSGTKAGVERMVVAVAKELGPRGIAVNVVAPGPVDNDFFRGAETPDSIWQRPAGSRARRCAPTAPCSDSVPGLGHAPWVRVAGRRAPGRRVRRGRSARREPARSPGSCCP
ncbi:SDR family oxidoreductase [Streptacidiphilus anmyonensis]|uniref:SDR family oxidoreductase n=1 Tax=Streptacidiphilus anmyonensis TaxID=405782 RepID=UPI0022A96CEE|nr:SDR family oxidoreductase [Streptacidiphilus anmyonensis]